MAVILAYGFEKQNVAFMAGLALATAASCNFPMLVAAIFWKSTTTRGLVWGGLGGLFASVALVIASKTIWVDIFHFEGPLFPYENPTLFTMPLAFTLIYIISITDRSCQRRSDSRPAWRSKSSH